MTTRKQRASAHARREFYCSCGKVVYGNGGRAAHQAKHDRLGDGHKRITFDRWWAEFREPAREEEA